MKLRLPLNKIRTGIDLFLAAALIAIVSISSFANLEKREVVEGSYHYSQWNEYVPEIERAFNSGSARSSGLSRAYGGVAPHHIPATIPRLVEFYSSLKATQSVKKIIIIGPDHTDAGKMPVTVSNAIFFTEYGKVNPIEGVARMLQEEKLAHIDEPPFDLEHSVGSHILIISKIFPEAKVTPIILRSDVPKDHAEALGKKIASLLDDETMLIASVDFSHYLSADQAMPLDWISGEVIKNLDAESLPIVEVDSPMSVATFVSAMKEKKAKSADLLDVLNTNDFMQNSDYTTGYIFGFWGVK